MNFAEFRELAQMIFFYYFMIGMAITLIFGGMRGIEFLRSEDNRKLLKKGVFNIIGFTIIGCISELVFPGSSFVFIVVAGMPTILFVIIPFIAYSLGMPLALFCVFCKYCYDYGLHGYSYQKGAYQ